MKNFKNEFKNEFSNITLMNDINNFAVFYVDGNLGESENFIRDYLTSVGDYEVIDIEDEISEDGFITGMGMYVHTNLPTYIAKEIIYDDEDVDVEEKDDTRQMIENKLNFCINKCWQNMDETEKKILKKAEMLITILKFASQYAPDEETKRGLVVYGKKMSLMDVDYQFENF